MNSLRSTAHTSSATIVLAHTAPMAFACARLHVLALWAVPRVPRIAALTWSSRCLDSGFKALVIASRTARRVDPIRSMLVAVILKDGAFVIAHNWLALSTAALLPLVVLLAVILSIRRATSAASPAGHEAKLRPLPLPVVVVVAVVAAWSRHDAHRCSVSLTAVHLSGPVDRGA